MSAQPIPLQITFRDRAELGLKYGIPVIPCEPNDKKTVIGTGKATTDRAIIDEWNAANPSYNTGLVAQAKSGGVWVLDCDSPEVSLQFKKDTGFPFPHTLMVQSLKGGHRYYRQNTESLKRLKNFAVKKDGREFFSVRFDDQYCCGPLSNHPDGGTYKMHADCEPIDAPDYVLDWLLQQYQEQEKNRPDTDDGGPILDGARNSTLASITGKLRNAGMSVDEMLPVMLRINQERCKPPKPDDEVKTIVNSVGRYPVGKAEPVLLIGGKIPGQPQPQTQLEVNIPTVEYPKFPEWVMYGTSIYQGFVKPICDKNSRYPEFMFIPAMALLLNYVGTRVRVEYSDLKLSWMMAIVGKRGETIKSSCVEDAIRYFESAGLAGYDSTASRNAEGKTIVFQAGSPEGLGSEMQRTNCNNAVLFYDELSSLVNKAGIEGSNLAQVLLTIYESGNFSNRIKRGKETYTIQPGSYCASLVACCPTKSFNELWAQLSSGKVGLDDRFFFLLEPETLKPLEPYVKVMTETGAVETRRLIDKAVRQGVYRFSTTEPFRSRINLLGNRPTIRAQKLALAFAIDLELDEIDEVCIERALAIIKYELEVKKYLGTSDAETKIAAAQIKLRMLLERSPRGRMELRDLKRKMSYQRYGTEGWFRIYSGLLKSNIIQEEGTGLPGDPKFVQLLEIIDQE